AQCTPSVVFVSDRRPEERHHPVTEELIDRPLVPVDRTEDHFERTVHERVDVFGIELLRHRREARYIREHHGDDLPLALEGALGGKNFRGGVLGGVGIGRREAGGRLRSGWPYGRRRVRQPLTALATELVAGRIGGLASGTYR